MTSPTSNNVSPRKAELERLLSALEPRLIELHDMSASHKNHVEGGGKETHFRLLIVAERFINLSSLERQRLIHRCLGTAWREGLHALEIKAQTPNEYNRQVKKTN